MCRTMQKGTLCLDGSTIDQAVSIEVRVWVPQRKHAYDKSLLRIVYRTRDVRSVSTSF